MVALLLCGQAPASSIAAGLPAAEPVPAPSNDAFSDAIDVGTATVPQRPNQVSVTGSTVGATRELGEFNAESDDPPNGTVWYRFTSPLDGFSGRLGFRVVDADGQVDHYTAQWLTTCAPGDPEPAVDALCPAASDAYPPNNLRYVWMEPGHTVWFQVARNLGTDQDTGEPYADGDFTLELFEVPNDQDSIDWAFDWTFADPLGPLAQEHSTDVDTFHLTPDLPGRGSNMWVRLPVETPGRLDLEVSSLAASGVPSTRPVAFSVYRAISDPDPTPPTGPRNPTLGPTPVAEATSQPQDPPVLSMLNPDNLAGHVARVTGIPVRPGTYYLSIESVDATPTFAYARYSYTPDSAPANDDFADALDMSTAAIPAYRAGAGGAPQDVVSFPGDTTRATWEDGELAALGGAGQPGGTVWYKYTAPMTGFAGRLGWRVIAADQSARLSVIPLTPTPVGLTPQVAFRGLDYASGNSWPPSNLAFVRMEPGHTVYFQVYPEGTQSDPPWIDTTFTLQLFQAPNEQDDIANAYDGSFGGWGAEDVGGTAWGGDGDTFHLTADRADRPANGWFTALVTHPGIVRLCMFSETASARVASDRPFTMVLYQAPTTATVGNASDLGAPIVQVPSDTPKQSGTPCTGGYPNASNAQVAGLETNLAPGRYYWSFEQPAGGVPTFFGLNARYDPGPKGDTTLPEVVINSPVDRSEYQVAPVLDFTCTDNSGTIAKTTVLVDRGSFTDLSAPLPAYPGQHTVQVICEDPAGLESSATHTYTIVEGPNTFITSKPASPTNASELTFQLSDGIKDSTNTFECAYDTSDFTPCGAQSPDPGGLPQLTVPAGDEGEHTFRVRTVDPSTGFKDLTPAQAIVVVDRTKPDIWIENAPDGTVSTPAATLTLRTNEPGTFGCAINSPNTGGSDEDYACGAANPATSVEVVIEDLGDGDVTFKAQARDMAGNWSDQVSVSWSVEVPPVVTISAPTDGATYFADNVPKLAHTCIDNSGSIAVEEFTEGGNVIDPADLPAAPGPHTIRVLCVDAAGLEGVSEVTYTVDEVPYLPSVTTRARGPVVPGVAVPFDVTVELRGARSQTGPVDLQISLQDGAWMATDYIPGLPAYCQVTVTGVAADGTPTVKALSCAIPRTEFSSTSPYPSWEWTGMLVRAVGPSGASVAVTATTGQRNSSATLGIGIPECTIIGTDGPDTLIGTVDQRDVICGLGGNDHLSAFGYDDVLIGGPGNDVLVGGRGDRSTLIGGAGDDQLSDGPSNWRGDTSMFGGDGNDTLGCGLGYIHVLDGGAGVDRIGGGSYWDFIFGGSGDDAVSGDPAAILAGGEDYIRGGGGNDRISGDGEADVIYGEDGDDTIDAGGSEGFNWKYGTDRVFGGNGADTIEGGTNRNVLNGGEGNDRLSGSDLRGSYLQGGIGDTLIGGPGDDFLDGKAGEDVLDGGLGLDQLVGGGGNDSLNGGDAADILNGGEGNDTCSGGGGADIISGGASNDMLVGGDGPDLVFGGAGNDTLVGGPGRDTLHGLEGDDIIRSAPDGVTPDTVIGGLGYDISFSDPADLVTAVEMRNPG